MKTIARSLLIVVICLPLLGQGNPDPPAQSGSAESVSAKNFSSAAPAATAAQDDKGNPDVKVWVNTASRVYHCPGSRWYGNTKQGQYMTQAEAQEKTLPAGVWKSLPVTDLDAPATGKLP